MEKKKDEKMKEHLALFQSDIQRTKSMAKEVRYTEKKKKNFFGEKEKMKLDLWF